MTDAGAIVFGLLVAIAVSAPAAAQGSPPPATLTDVAQLVGDAHFAQFHGNCARFDATLARLEIISKQTANLSAARRAADEILQLRAKGCREKPRAAATNTTNSGAAVPVEYVKVCSDYGPGYFYMPGTEICLKFNRMVWVRGEYSAKPVPAGAMLPPVPPQAGQCGNIGANYLPGSNKCIILGPNGRYVTLDLGAPAPARTPERTPDAVGTIDPAKAWGGPYIGVNMGGTIGYNDVFNSKGATIGIQAGIGQVIGSDFYAGVEAALGYGTISATRTGRRTTEVLEENASISLLARFGVISDNVMIYAAGGFNVADTEYTRTRRHSIKSDGEWVLVPLLGGGIEIKVAPNVSFGVRYMYEWRPAVEYLEKHKVESITSGSIKGYINYQLLGSDSDLPQISSAETAYDWNRLYFGANAGGAGGKNEFVEQQGGSIGLQAGAGVAMGSVYFGIQSDYNFQGVTGSKMAFGLTEQQSQEALVSLRGLFGLANPRALVFATAGVAFARTQYSIHGMGIHDVESQWITGTTVGGGVEVPLTGSLSAGLKYEFMHLPSAKFFHGTFENGATNMHSLNVFANYRFGPTR